ncbi:MAG TPA: enhanced serine sensitivity protein SseB C-terminal domain-containing protein [Motilibacteraceae bacterium]|nr:enhanced serine sensitivity protein SseB C-terminal domain-containing protein [Motilibacteraceae bacterium]
MSSDTGSDPGTHPDEDLERLLGGAGDREAVLAALRGATVYVPAQREGDRPGEPAAGLALPVLQRGDRRFVPAFTSLELARSLTRPGTGQAAVPMPTLAGSLGPDLWVVLNPSDASETLLAPGELRAVAGLPPADVATLAPGTPVRLGEPAHEPAVLPALAAAFAALPAVAAAYRALVQTPGSAPRLVVGVQAPPEEMGAVLSAVEQSLRGSTRPDLDLVRVGDGSEVSGWMVDRTAPFYTRGRS